MRLFSRLMMVVGLLGGLAFGSYAFGKYVLSNRLFGPQGSAMQRHSSEGDGDHFGSTVSRSSAVKGSPRAEIDVLPSDEAGDAPEPDLSTARKHTERRPIDDGIVKKPADAPQYDAEGNPIAVPTPTATVEVTINQDDNPDGSPAPRKRHRRKHVLHRVKSTDGDTTSTSGNDNTDSLPARAVNNDNSVPRPPDTNSGTREDSPTHDLAPALPVGRSDNSHSDSSHSDSSRSDDSATAPAPKIHRHHRERIRHDGSAVSTPDRLPTHRSTPTRRHEDSPVPRPEGDSGGGSGGDSPVPLPG